MSVEVEDDLVTLGKKFYDEKLKAILEPEHNGEFVAIEPYLEKYVIDKDEVQVMLKAMEEMPKSKFYFVRIGHKYAHKIGWSSVKTIGGVSQRVYFQNVGIKSKIQNQKSKIQ
jgi:hypothetical protein